MNVWRVGGFVGRVAVGGVGRKRFITYQSIENRAAYLCEGRAKAAGPADPAEGSA